MAKELGIGLIETDKERKSVKVDFLQSEHQELEEYQLAYRSVYGRDVDLAVLVHALAMKSLSGDRQFKAWRKEQQASNTSA